MVFAWVWKKFMLTYAKRGFKRCWQRRRGDGRTTTKALISKTRTLQTFCYNSHTFKPSLHHVQFLNFTFHGGRKYATTNIYFFFPNLDMCDIKNVFCCFAIRQYRMYQIFSWNSHYKSWANYFSVLKTREFASGMICKWVTVSHIFINSSSFLPHILRNPFGLLAWLEHSTGDSNPGKQEFSSFLFATVKDAIRPFARWRRFTTSARIPFVFPFILKIW